jgi:hypothetical protein
MAKKKRKLTRREKERRGMTPPDGKSRYASKASRDATQKAEAEARQQFQQFGRFP